ncbi:hypothetical protein F5Y09DRAFT_322510 [Xylaria sp. FL1042]|nr:hypothetical protein F5Y09DRAFT_322510 [Xylaria sp. FL1042]
MVQSRSWLDQCTNESDTDRPTNSASNILDMVVRCLSLDRGDRYLSKPAPVDDYREEFLHFAHGTQVERDTPEEDFQRWLRENRDFRFQGTRLEDLCKTLGSGGLGCNVPVLLRPRVDSTYQLIRECYLEGYINGELFTKSKNFDTDDFVLV